MGFWTKKERYNPQTEKFEAVERKPLFEKKEPSEVKELTREEQIEPKRQHPWQDWSEQRKVQKKKEKEAYREAYSKSRVKRMTQLGHKAGSITLGDRLDNFSRGFNTGPSHRTQGNYNPFGSMFDTGMKKPSKKKSSSGKSKYIIRGGKAYLIVGTGKQKKKKSSSGRRKSRDDPFSFDVGFDKGW